jgi:hypothetical protein
LPLSRAACWLWARTALAGLRGDRDRLLRRLAQAIPTCQATFTGERHPMGLRHADEPVQAIRGTAA